MEPQGQQPENSAPSNTPNFNDVPERFHERYLFVGGHQDGERMYVSPVPVIRMPVWSKNHNLNFLEAECKHETYRACQLGYEGRRWKVYLLSNIGEAELIPMLLARYVRQGAEPKR